MGPFALEYREVIDGPLPCRFDIFAFSIAMTGFDSPAPRREFLGRTQGEEDDE
jgi:hypothetical protein